MNSCLSQEGPLALGEAFAPRRQPSEHNDVSSEDVSETLVGVNQAVVAANAIIPAAMPARTSRWAFARNLSTLHLANVPLGEEGGRAIAGVGAEARAVVRGGVGERRRRDVSAARAKRGPMRRVRRRTQRRGSR